MGIRKHGRWKIRCQRGSGGSDPSPLTTTATSSNFSLKKDRSEASEETYFAAGAAPPSGPLREISPPFLTGAAFFGSSASGKFMA